MGPEQTTEKQAQNMEDKKVTAISQIYRGLGFRSQTQTPLLTILVRVQSGSGNTFTLF